MASGVAALGAIAAAILLPAQPLAAPPLETAAAQTGAVDIEDDVPAAESRPEEPELVPALSPR